MLIKKAYKLRIYPTKEQETLIAKTIGCSRFVFNHFLDQLNDTYKRTGKGLPYVFTDGHAIRRLSNFYTDLSDLDKIDWDVMESNYWNDTDEDMNRKARRQSEFLVYNQVPLSACLGFAVYSYEAKVAIEKILEKKNLSIPVAVRRHFYY